MTATANQIDLWRQSPENQRLEFKEAKQQFDTRKLSEYCVALANEGGGVLLLGVADEPPRAVVGTQAFPDTVDAAEKLFQWVGFRVDVEAVALRRSGFAGPVHCVFDKDEKGLIAVNTSSVMAMGQLR